MGIQEQAHQQVEDSKFRREFELLLNKYSKENGSNTPDHILVDFLIGCLAVWDRATNDRERWYNRE